MKPTIVLHYCDNDISFALLKTQADIDLAMSIEKNILANPDVESILEWFEVVNAETIGESVATATEVSDAAVASIGDAAE